VSHLGVSVGQFVRKMGQMGHRKGVFRMEQCSVSLLGFCSGNETNETVLRGIFVSLLI